MSERSSESHTESSNQNTEHARVADTCFGNGDRRAAVEALEQIDNQQLRDLIRIQWWSSLSEQEQNYLIGLPVVDQEKFRDLPPELSDPD